jgi:hypothetical protein
MTFTEVVSTHKIKFEKLLRASRAAEAHTADDAALATQRAAIRKDKKEGAAAAYKEGQVGKPRSGRAVTRLQIEAALRGEAVSGRVRGKLARALKGALPPAAQADLDRKKLFAAPKA